MTVKIGIIGVGNVGKKHIEECLASNEIELVGCCSKTEKSAKEIERNYGVNTLTDYKNFLNLEMDGVIISLPTKFHKQTAIDCIKKGINILLEKPFCTTKEDAEEITKFAEDNHKIIMPCHDFLHSKGIVFLLDYLRKNDLGNLKEFSIKKIGSDFISLNPGEEQDMEEVFNTAYHLSYLVGSLVDSKIKNSKIKEINPYMKNIKIFSDLIFENDIRCTIEVNKSKELPRRMQIIMDYENCTLVWNFDYNEERVFIKDGEELYKSNDISQRSNLINDFVNKIKNKDYSEVSNAARTMEIAEAMIKSSEQENKRKSAYIQITRKCNNDCVFCSNPKFEAQHSLETVERILKEYKEDNVNEVFITGGEPTTHENLVEIIQLVRKYGIKVRMITNGIKLADKEYLQKIVNTGLDSISISFHTNIEELSEKMHDNKEAVAEQKKAISNLESISFPFFINTTINSLNYKRLPDFIKFLKSNFENVNHIVFNFLDPGFSDGINLNNAGKNPWIVPKHSDVEPYLHKSLKLMRNYGMTFRIERVPLCYLNNFEEFSTETRKIVKEEKYICSFTRDDEKNTLRKVSPKELRVKVEACTSCMLNEICAGIQKEYLHLYGEGEIYPVFKSKESIIEKIK